MNASSQSAQSATPSRVQRAIGEADASPDEDDFAIGCECAYPALQIDTWGDEAATQPLQRLI